MDECAIGPNQQCEHLGHVRLDSLYLYMMLCSIDAIGVTPIPEPMSTACSVSKISLVAVPYGPSMKH